MNSPAVALIQTVEVNALSAAVSAREVGVRHAKLQGQAACVAATIATELQTRSNLPSGKLGVICNGGPWNIQPSWEFLGRMREAGPTAVNPLLFPSTLVSNTATLAAARVGAHAFAQVVGHDRMAFFHVLNRSVQAIRNGFADYVFAIAVCGTDPAILRVANATGTPPPLPTGIGFTLGRVDRAAATAVRLLQVACRLESGRQWRAAAQYEFEWVDHKFVSASPPLEISDALGASGARMCLIALQHAAAVGSADSVLVTARVGSRSGMARFSTGTPY